MDSQLIVEARVILPHECIGEIPTLKYHKDPPLSSLVPANARNWLHDARRSAKVAPLAASSDNLSVIRVIARIVTVGIIVEDPSIEI